MKLLFDMTESLLDSVVRFSSLPGVLYMPVSSRESSPSSLGIQKEYRNIPSLGAFGVPGVMRMVISKD